MFSIDVRSREPIYEQLVQNILDLIINHALMPDDQLPSVRNLARDLGINPNTVQKAYQELETRGLIYQAAGRGSFISPNDSLAQSVVEQKLKDLKTPMRAAKRAGVSKQKIIELTESVYGEEDGK